MREFARLYESIDRTTSTNEKVEAIAEFLRACEPVEGAWVIFFLTGGKLKRLISGRTVAEWVSDRAGLRSWLFRECYAAVGDLAETISLVLDAHAAPAVDDAALDVWIDERLEPLRGEGAGEQRRKVIAWLLALGRTERFLLVKLMTGELRVGVSRTLVVRAIARAFDVPSATIAHRLTGSWKPTASLFRALAQADSSDVERSRPYPFYLASPIEEMAIGGVDAGPFAGSSRVTVLGSIHEWQIEWKWDGIRAQLIVREGRVSVWSRGDEDLTERFPEIVEAGARIARSAVLDGEILCWSGGQDGRPLPFARLQRRIGRVSLSRRVLAEAPAVFMTYDVLEIDGQDIRTEPLTARRALAEQVVCEAGSHRLLISPLVTSTEWSDAAVLRQQSRERGVEGLMLKRRSSPYQVGRVKGDWWKWKVDPYSVDAVMVHAEPGHGRRASLLTDYTFALWEGTDLVPFARAYSGLSNEEIAELDRWIRQHTTARHGPVRVVEPVHVFEIAFEGIARSTRHRGGVAVRFPRIARWRRDKSASDADSVMKLKALLPPENPGGQGLLFDRE